MFYFIRVIPATSMVSALIFALSLGLNQSGSAQTAGDLDLSSIPDQVFCTVSLMSESGHDSEDVKPLRFSLSNIRSQNRVQMQDNAQLATGGFLSQDGFATIIQFRSGESFAILSLETNELQALFLGSLDAITVVSFIGYEWDKPYGESTVGQCSITETL